jgi:hypothetical protein
MIHINIPEHNFSGNYFQIISLHYHESMIQIEQSLLQNNIDSVINYAIEHFIFLPNQNPEYYQGKSFSNLHILYLIIILVYKSTDAIIIPNRSDRIILEIN